MLRKVLLFFLIALLIVGGGMFFAFWRGIQQINDFVFADVNLANIADGVYQGDVAAGPIQVIVDVIVQDAQIAEIKLIKHDHGKGEAAESIVDEIITQQSLQVDTVSGATYSSRVILKAVESALLH
ncbi:MAG TPA: FMN-binding protein [Oscillospiraceae bacterium]|nr:FMN-binding protein [Oscillospiraceae bacterium]